tara:strand:- start:12 stop:167 length:156 start_codon:yes stop_codon:yes gene_type:complete
MINLICHLFPEITQRNDRWYVVSKKKNYNESSFAYLIPKKPKGWSINQVSE